MDASTKKRVLVATMALLMVLSSAAMLFQQTHPGENANGAQNAGYMVGTALSSNGLNTQSGVEAMSTVNAVLVTYPVTFTSIGLPSGTSWSATVDGTNTVSTIYSSITFQLSNGSHSFEISNPNNYMASPSSGAVLVYGSPVVQYITFSPVQYELRFNEAGLPTGSSWTVNLSGQIQSSITDSMVFSLQNGTYSYTVTGPANYLPSPSTGKAVVYGQDEPVNVQFTSSIHKVTFNFGGSANGTSLDLNFAGQLYSVSGNSLSVLKSDGLYNYSISTGAEHWATPSNGTILVMGGNATLNVTVYEKTYTIAFEHQGVSAGTYWEVTLNGVTHNSTSSVITFQMPAGNYSYDVTGVSGYTAASDGGYVNVVGQNSVVNVTFSKNTDYFTGTMLLLAGAAIGVAAGIGIGIYLVKKK